MCGFFGIYERPGRQNSSAIQQEIALCSQSLTHRGPDGEGIWIDDAQGIAFCHRRLSVIDLSETGSQPMHSADERYCFIFNGEIYNYKTISTLLEQDGKRMRGRSDSEVFLEAIASFGIRRACNLANGMFAFALWDKKKKSLTLARDPFGQKPLYYGWSNNILFFGSELKPFMCHPRFKAQTDRDSLNLFLRHGYIPAPRSIFQSIGKLTQGTIVHFSSEALKTSSEPICETYFDSHKKAEEAMQDQFVGSFDDAKVELETLLIDAISQASVSDVPLGSFLSGGVDSSLVVALAQKELGNPMKTYSIGFRDRKLDESIYAKAVAEHLGTDHTELILTQADALSIVPQLAEMYDEPFADSSQLPTHLVSKLARKHVTVALSGDAGDELFAGYNRYRWADSVAGFTNVCPSAISGFIGTSIRGVKTEYWDGLAQLAGRRAPSMLGDKMHKLAEIIDKPNIASAYLAMTSLWHNPELLTGHPDPYSNVLTSFRLLSNASNIERMMLADTQTYLADDILAKVDRASMAAGLEVRVPFLDPRIMSFAWRLPQEMKINRSESKKILRRILYKYVPKHLIERPKMGFGMPVGTWLQGELRPWAESLLSIQNLQDSGLFEAKPIRTAWEEHLSGRRNWQYQIWAVLMALSWQEQWQAAKH